MKDIGVLESNRKHLTEAYASLEQVAAGFEYGIDEETIGAAEILVDKLLMQARQELTLTSEGRMTEAYHCVRLFRSKYRPGITKQHATTEYFITLFDKVSVTVRTRAEAARIKYMTTSEAHPFSFYELKGAEWDVIG
jgi:hypothetical protein